MAKQEKKNLGPAYFCRYNVRKEQSPVLNPTKYSLNWTALSLSDENGLRRGLEEYERRGNPDAASDYYGKIQIAEMAAEKKEEEFERFKQQKVNLGYRPPTEMPSDMRERYEEALAELDVVKEEACKIKSALLKWGKKKQEDSDRQVLYYGPIGHGKGDPLREIDGQTVKQNKNGILNIDDHRSPYNKMRVVDYRERIVLPFIRQRQGSLHAVRRDNLPPRPEGV